MDSSTMAYFQTMNPLSRKIVQDTKMVQDLFEEKWEQYDEKRQNEILNDFFVHPEVRKKYQNYEKSDSYPISYPVLKIQMGEKIVVDETNDFWTWQDEFSGPFSWKSKSQQDLTLLDLEPEQMTKQSKTRRRNSRDLTEELDKKAEREFCVQEPEKSLWYSEFKNLKNCDFKKSYNANESIKTNEIPTSNHTNGNVKTDHSPEEINYAFSRDSFIETCEQRNKNGKSDLISVTTSNENKKDRKLETGSASKRKYDIEMSVFENPMISQFVEDEDNLSSSSTSPSHRPLLKGYDASSPSRKPLLKGDSQDSSTSVKSQLYEPQTQSIERHDQIDGNVIGTDDKSQLVSADDYEDTDLIAVDVNSGMYSLNDSQGSMNSLNITKSGFDFLDQW